MCEDDPTHGDQSYDAYEDQSFDDQPFEFNMVMLETPTCREEDSNLIGGVVCERENTDDTLVKSASRRWLLDSGASSHYIKDISRFRAYQWLSQPIRINTGKGPILGVARGEVDVVMSIGNVVIGDVLLVPDLDVPSDLLSVSALMRAGLGVTFQSGCATIHNDGTKWGVATPLSGSNMGDGGLCYLEEYERVDHYVLASQCVDTQPVEIWHRRLGHLHPRAIRQLTSIVTGIKIGDPPNVGNRNVDCVDCLKGTQHQIISRFPYTQATKPLERVSAEIAGPMSCPDCT